MEVEFLERGGADLRGEVGEVAGGLKLDLTVGGLHGCGSGGRIGRVGAGRVGRRGGAIADSKTVNLTRESI